MTAPGYVSPETPAATPPALSIDLEAAIYAARDAGAADMILLLLREELQGQYPDVNRLRHLVATWRGTLVTFNADGSANL